MSIQIVSRKRDDQILQWLTWRSEGHTPKAITEHEGMTGPNVRVATNAVLRADLSEGGECPNVIRKAYWA